MFSSRVWKKYGSRLILILPGAIIEPQMYTWNSSWKEVPRTLFFFQICGLTLATDIDSLAVLYLATLQALAVSNINHVNLTTETICYRLSAE